MTAKARSLAEQLRDKWSIETTGATPLSEVFAEEPPSLDVFVRDRQYMDNLPLSPPQFDLVRHIEQVLNRETYILMVEEFGPHWAPVRFVNELSAEWGKGGGKDHTCQIAFARVANIVLCLKDPQDYYDMPHQTIIHMMNVAAASAQAHGVFFKPLRTLLTRSRWFADKFESEQPGPQATEIHFKKQLELISGHSSAETLEGKNLLVAIADEISAFPTMHEVRINRSGRTPAKTADGILEMLRSSATTRFPKQFKLVQISYPRFEGDAIQQATKTGNDDLVKRGQSSVYYVSGPLKSWDVNPRLAALPRVTVPGAGEPVPDVPSIVKDYEDNPAYARGKYECAPSFAENRYFSNDTLIHKAFEEVRAEDPVGIEYYWGKEDALNWEQDESGQLKEKLGWQVRFHFAPDFVPFRGALYAVHGDMAITGDRAGVAMCHVRNWERRVWERADTSTQSEQRPIVKVDFVTSFSADKAAVTPDGQNVPREVQIRWYRKLIWELVRRNFLVTRATFDRFASADTIQILESRGIESERVSTDTNNLAWENLRDVMYDGRLEAYWRQRVVSELQHLNLLSNGRVDHPPSGSKDEADALAGATLGAVVLGGDETDSPERADADVIDLFTVHADQRYSLESAEWSLHPGDFGGSRYEG